MDVITSYSIHYTKLYEAGGTLYQRYVKYGLIPEDEVHGGSINYLKIGLKYDSRDQLACPMSGIWTEAVLQTAPDLIIV